MNTKAPLQAYRDSSDPSIAISDAQAAWILKWAEEREAEFIKKRETDMRDMISSSREYGETCGREEALAEVLERLQGVQWTSMHQENGDAGFATAIKRFFELIRSLQSPTEKKCCDTCSSKRTLPEVRKHLGGPRNCWLDDCSCYRKEHEEQKCWKPGCDSPMPPVEHEEHQDI